MTHVTGYRKSLDTFGKRPLMGSVLILILIMMMAFEANAGAPLAAIQTQVDKLLGVLRDPSFKALPTEKEKTEKIWPIVDGIFDYTALSQRALSRNWRKLNKEQQEEFTKLFSKLLGSIYMSRILKYSDEKVVYTEEKMLSEDKAEVDTNIVTASKEIPINYRLILINGEWRVYDVVIEGISLVANYRSQFRQILADNSPQALLDMLKKKVNEL